MQKRVVCWVVFGLAVTVSLVSSARADEEGLRIAISNIAKKYAIKQLKDKVFRFSEGGFEGSVKAIDPDKNIDVKTREFSLSGDLVKLGLTAKGRFEISGTLKQISDKINVSAETEVEIFVTGKGRFLEEGGEFYIDPSVDDLDVRLNVTKVSPSSLSGGTALMSDIANSAFKLNKKLILDRIGKSLRKQKLRI